LAHVVVPASVSERLHGGLVVRLLGYELKAQALAA
jgi:hypothetical protein